jgi:hypothetical protein
MNLKKKMMVLVQKLLVPVCRVDVGQIKYWYL